MTEVILQVVSWLLLASGGAFLVVGAVGVVRMPDVFTRMHAASVIDTLGAGLVVAGLMVQAGVSLVTLKLFFLLVLVLFSGPVVSHALAQAALHAGVVPLLHDDRRNRFDGPGHNA
jgi:multicomponent Na+:H+ antiporter subunit G